MSPRVAANVIQVSLGTRVAHGQFSGAKPEGGKGGPPPSRIMLKSGRKGASQGVRPKKILDRVSPRLRDPMLQCLRLLGDPKYPDVGHAILSTFHFTDRPRNFDHP